MCSKYTPIQTDNDSWLTNNERVEACKNRRSSGTLVTLLTDSESLDRGYKLSPTTGAESANAVKEGRPG